FTLPARRFPRPPGRHNRGCRDDAPGLLAVLAKVTDPRHRRGVRHRPTGMLNLAVCAVLAGGRAVSALSQWAAAVACESTIRRVRQRLDADAFDGLAGAWAQRRTAPNPEGAAGGSRGTASTH